MNGQEVRRVVSLEASGETFVRAWGGQPTMLPAGAPIRDSDLLILREVDSKTKSFTGREVQGCRVGATDDRGRPAAALVPTLRWDLTGRFSTSWPTCMDTAEKGAQDPVA